MKTNSFFFTIVFFLFSLSAWSQSDYLNIVKTHYPQVYRSILESVGQQWDDPQIRGTVMEGQAKAFLSIAESQDPMDEGLLAEAIITNSLSGAKESNTKVLDDLSIDNPYPLLMCDWYKVKSYYERRMGVGAVKEYTASATKKPVQTQTTQQPSQTTTSTEIQIVVEDDDEPVTVVDYDTRSNTSIIIDDHQTSYTYTPPTRNESYSDDSYTYFSRSGKSQKEAKASSSRFHLGIKVAGGLNSMYNLGSYINEEITQGPNQYLQLKSRLGVAFEGGLVGIYKKDGFFIQNETGVQYLKAEYKNVYFNSSGQELPSEERTFNNSYLYLQTAFHLGGYYEVSKGVSLLAGVGPYLGFRLNSSYADYGVFNFAAADAGAYEEFMKDGEENVTFGVNGVFGVDWNRIRIALYPSIGLTRVHTYDEHKPFGMMLGLTFWCF